MPMAPRILEGFHHVKKSLGKPGQMSSLLGSVGLAVSPFASAHHLTVRGKLIILVSFVFNTSILFNDGEIATNSENYPSNHFFAGCHNFSVVPNPTLVQADILPRLPVQVLVR